MAMSCMGRTASVRKPPTKEFSFALREEPLHGVGGVRDVEEFVRIRLNKLNLHLFVPNLNASFGIHLLGGHGRPVPMALALHKFHWADHPDLDLLSKSDCKRCHSKD